MPWRKRTIGSDGVHLSVRDSGGSGRPVLLIHGLGLTQRSWGRVSHRLASRFRVVTYDQRGHGASTRASRYSRSAFRRDLEAVAAALDLKDVILVGHSLGGYLAVEYAAAHPDCAGVIGVEGGIRVDLPAADWVRMEGGGRKLVADVAMAVMRLLRRGTALSYDEMRGLADENEQWVRGLGEAYDRLSCPVLLVLGSRADRVPQGVEIRESVRRGARALQEAHPEVAVDWVPSGHLVPLERPAELAAIIGRFNDSLE